MSWKELLRSLTAPRPDWRPTAGALMEQLDQLREDAVKSATEADKDSTINELRRLLAERDSEIRELRKSLSQSSDESRKSWPTVSHNCSFIINWWQFFNKLFLAALAC